MHPTHLKWFELLNVVDESAGTLHFQRRRLFVEMFPEAPCILRSG
jgi:hypothetical protein